MSQPMSDRELRTIPYAAPKSANDVQRAADRSREALLNLIGRPPFAQSPPLKPRGMYTARHRSYTRIKVRYGSETDDVVWAWLLVPEGIDFTSEDIGVRPAKADSGTVRPAVICLPGSFMTPNYGKDGPVGLAGPEVRGAPEAYGADLAARGFVTLCPDYPVAGERTSPGLKAYDTSALDAKFPSWTRTGLSTWDVSRAVDFLSKLPIVRPDRIGVMGWSQGGLMSFLGAALDTRIRAVVSVCGWRPFRGITGQILENLMRSYNFPGMRRYFDSGSTLPFDLDHLFAAVAPRPMLDIRGTKDRFTPDRSLFEVIEREAAATYRLLGAEGAFRAYWFYGEHGYNADGARETEAWLYRHLWDGDGV